MDGNVYTEACNVYATCNDDGSNDYEEAGTGSPSRDSAERRAHGVNQATSTSDLSAEPGSNDSHDNRKAADPGSASAETAGCIPGVGMKSPGQSQVFWKAIALATIVLLGTVIFLVVTVLGLKLSISQLDQRTADGLSDIKLNNKKILEKLNVTNVLDKLEEERTLPHMPAACSGGYKKYRQICYKAFDIKKTFSESTETCVADGGTLAMPRDAGINAFLISLKDEVEGDWNRFFWFGLHDERQEGNWEWIDGAALGTGYSSWADVQTDNSWEDQHCAVYGFHQWLVLNCDSAERFICQVLPSGAAGGK
ncbi:C-type lectin domain family 3 member A homolog [Branchiostoma lanceolatum]|uniref:C-type lectin domain family 3 member A homolog n=1 Tax=Branchiostoma lanceolatum TaxID=7740 RepID=UPI003454E33D